MSAQPVLRSISTVLLIVVLTGCNPKQQQAAPQMVVGGIAALSGAKKGFFVTDGQPTYHDWNAGVGNIVKPLQGADADSFKAFEFPKRAAALYARDSTHVYMAMGYTPREIKGADAATFELLTPDGLYSRDANQVYYLGVPLKDCDPSTFEILMFPFSQDKTKAYIGATSIPSVDRESWRPLRRGFADSYWEESDNNELRPKEQNSVWVEGWSKDDRAFYYGRAVVSGIDVATFEVLSDYYARDKNHVYSRHYNTLAVIKGADPASFAVSADVDEVVTRGMGEDAHDAKSKYLNGKVFVP